MARFGKFDLRGMKELQKNLQKLQDPDKFAEQCTKELAARLLAKVIKRTPVGDYPKETGKKGGTLRRGWTAGQSQAAFIDSLTVRKEGSKYVIEIINPVEYASYVEYGHRTRDHKGWVKGRLMMTISENEVANIAPKVLEAKLKKYLGGAFK